jgi:hypothetical protein
MGLLVICMRESCVERPKPGIDRDVLATPDRHVSCSDRARPLGGGALLGSVICLASPRAFGTCFGNVARDALSPWHARSKQDNEEPSQLPMNS